LGLSETAPIRHPPANKKGVVMSDTAKTIFYIVLALLLIVPFAILFFMHGKTDLLTGFDKFYFFATAILVFALWVAVQVDETPVGLMIGIWVATGCFAFLSGLGENDATLLRGGALVLLTLSFIAVSLHLAFMHNFPTVWGALYALLPIVSFFIVPLFADWAPDVREIGEKIGIISAISMPAALLIDKILDKILGVIPSGGGSTRTVSFSSVENAMRAYNRSSTKCVGGVKQYGNRIIVQLSGINGYSASGWEAAQVRSHLESWLGVNLDRTNISIYY